VKRLNLFLHQAADRPEFRVVGGFALVKLARGSSAKRNIEEAWAFLLPDSLRTFGNRDWAAASVQ
jgi:hypothetical protein